MTFEDQMGSSLRLPHWPPRRIVSLVPSQTELLADLELENEVVGITKFCVRPAAWFQSKPRVGGTKTLDFQKIAAMQPDLIIGNKEENEQGQIEALAPLFPVWMSDISTLEHALDMMRRVGALTGKFEKANELAAAIGQQFDHLLPPPVYAPKVLYLIWRKPFMAAARGTFIDDMLSRAGFENVLSGQSRYPEISPAQLADLHPDLIFLSSEPYPFSVKHFPELQEICPQARIQLVDGEIFSWYGSRLRHAPAYFNNLRQEAGVQ